MLGDGEDDDWTEFFVRQYFDTAQKGYPFIPCPDELRPSNASIDSWWIIYAPRFDGGFVIEGYRIDDLRSYQDKLFVSWCIIGLLIYYSLAFGNHFGLAFAFVVSWFFVLFLGGYLLGRVFVADRSWVPFPAKLREALRTRNDLVTKAEKKRESKKTISETVGKIAGAAGGFLVEAAAGKAAGKVSEMAVEAACKALVHRAMH